MIAEARACLRLMSDTVGRLAVARLIALQVLVALMEGLGLVLLVPVLQALGGSNRLKLPGVSLHVSLTQAFAMVIAVVCLRALGQWRAAVLAVDIRLTTIDTMRLRLIDDLYASDWSYLADQRRSHVVQRLTTDVERAHSALATLVRLVVGTLVLLATIAVALLIAPAIGGLAVAVLVLVTVLAGRSTRGAAVLGRTMTTRMAGFGAALSDSLASMRVMRAHGAAAAWSDLVAGEATRVRQVRRSFVDRSAGIGAALGVVAVLAVLAVILVGRKAGMSVAELATLAVVATRLLTSAQNLLTSAQTFANDAPALTNLTAFGAEARAHREQTGSAPATVPADLSAPLVSLRGIGISYASDPNPVLEGVDLDVPRHGLVAVTGPSGSGKSTLLDIVLGLLPPDTGQVLVDGAPLQDLVGWRARVGYAPQQTVLVPGTVLQNLAWSAQPGKVVTRDVAWNALWIACLDEVVAALPGGLLAPLHDMAELSGGEQQRLSIARALVRDPELLVIDEATSGLDHETEMRVLDRLLDGSRTVLLVTHRTATASRADATLRLEDGRVVPR
ncbi:MAG: transporter, ATP-binding protein [Marmoricola sp.]|nr:transporter, ATP-binding protein [Marmoricola sp.]